MTETALLLAARQSSALSTLELTLHAPVGAVLSNLSDNPLVLTTYVLGAGFSRPAGLPLGHEIFPEVIRFAKRDRLNDDVLGPDLERYRLFMRRTTGKAVAENNINFEELVAFLDVEHSLKLKGKDTWTDQGNESQLVIRNLIAQVLWYRQQAMKPDVQQLYDAFAARLDDSDIVFTFNYDTILEDSLDRIGKPYRLFPSRYQELNHGVGALATTDNEVVILKMHGSMDWFDRTSFEKQSAYWSEQGHPGQPPDEVFSRSANVLEPLVNGLYPEHSPLKKIYRLRNLETYLWNASMVHDAPVIITPSFNKDPVCQPGSRILVGLRVQRELRAQHGDNRVLDAGSRHLRTASDLFVGPELSAL